MSEKLFDLPCAFDTGGIRKRMSCLMEADEARAGRGVSVFDIDRALRLEDGRD